MSSDNTAPAAGHRVAPDVLLSTERLLVRDWRATDAADAFAIFGDPEVTRYLGNPVPKQDLDEQRAWLSTVMDRAPALRPLGFWAMERRSDASVVGSVLLYPLAGTSDVEIGWHLRRTAWGSGYATEAAKALVGHAFGTLLLPRLYALVADPNIGSSAVAVRLGMHLRDRTSQFYGREFLRYELVAPAAP